MLDKSLILNPDPVLLAALTSSLVGSGWETCPQPSCSFQPAVGASAKPEFVFLQVTSRIGVI